MDKNGGSRLLQMQARFQQKQMQEREMKIASLYEAQQARALDRVRHSPSSTATSAPQPPAPLNHPPGKVRQMFEERRTKAGIDKSYPLQPIHNTERSRKPLPNGYSKVSTTTASKATVEKRTVRTQNSHTIKKQQHKTENLVNGSGDLNHNHKPDLNTTKHVLPKNKGEIISRIDELDRADNNYLLENETFPEALAPSPTPRSPEPEPKKPPRRNPATRDVPAKTKPQATPTAPPRRAVSDNSVTESSKPRGAMQRTLNTVPKRQAASPTGKSRPGAVSSGSVVPASGGSGGSGTPCTVCGRRFAPDRLAKHQEICKKAHAKKRKPFDALKHRLAGTEAEPFINKLRKTAPNASTNKVTTKPLNNNWRQKHEEFIQAIRAAKQVQAHLNAGGKLSDLPPPPPSENPDYVQCPHCSRRFNQAAAERHIPKCASYSFNKPKPNAKKR